MHRGRCRRRLAAMGCLQAICFGGGAREGRLQADDETTGFAQAVVACEASESVTAPGRIEIVLASGVRVIVDRNVDVGALMRVISAVERR